MKVLVIEDYRPLRESIAQGLQEAGYVVESTGDGEEGLWFARESVFNVIVLDLMLPSMHGLQVLRKLREEGNPVHVLILTAKDTVEDRVAGLDLGADDYLVKPFAFRELLARVRALVRRSYRNKSPVIQVADLEVDTCSRSVRRAGQEIEFTSREYNLLEMLALQNGKVVSRDEIWEHLFDFAADINSNLIDVYISNIRKKLERGGRPRIIHTRRGAGYILEAGF